MAAAVIPIVGTAIQVIAPAIPSIISWVEGLFGHSSTTGKQSGAQKLETVVSIITNALTGMANSGLLPSAGIVDPAFKTELQKVVQQVVENMQKAGLLNGATTVPVVSAVPGAAAVTAGATLGIPAAQIQAPAVAAAGNTFTLNLAPGQAFTISLAKA